MDSSPQIPPRNYAGTSNFPSQTFSPLMPQANFGANYLLPYGGGYFNYQPNPLSFGGASQLSNFVQTAEDSSRKAFTSIEQIVGAFVSVSNLMASTHQAFFNSFRAIIAVIDQFRILKEQMFSVVIVYFYRWVRVLWRRLLVFLRLRPRNYDISSELIEGGSNSGPKLALNLSSLLFWIVAIGGPYLLLKYFTKMVKMDKDSKKWATGDDEHYLAKALHNFTATNDQEISFSVGDSLRIAPKKEQMSNNHDWILASNLDGKRIGFVPINHIKLEKKITSKTNSNDLQRKTSSSSFQSQKSISDLSSAECYKSEWEAIFSNLKDLSRC